MITHDNMKTDDYIQILNTTISVISEMVTNMTMDSGEYEAMAINELVVAEDSPLVNPNKQSNHIDLGRDINFSILGIIIKIRQVRASRYLEPGGISMVGGGCSRIHSVAMSPMVRVKKMAEPPMTPIEEEKEEDMSFPGILNT